MSSKFSKYKLGEIINFSYGKMPKQEYLNTGKYPTFSGYKYQYLYPEMNCKKGDVIVVARGVGGTGDVKIVQKDCYLTNLAIKFDLNNEIIDNKYCFYHYFLSTLRHLDSGSAQSQITINDLSNLEIIIPPLSTQKKIAHILSTLDDKIELNRKMNQTLEEMASAIFKSWFVDFDPVHVKFTCKDENDLETIARELGISKVILDLFPSEFEESELGMIPKGWEVKEFSSLVKHLKPGTNYQPDRVEDGIPFVNGKHIQDGFLDLTDIKYITQDEYDRVHKSWQPEAYDVLITRIGTLGKVGVIMPSDLPLALHYNSIDIKAGKLNHQFLYFLLKSDFFQKQFHTNKKQAVQEFITIEAVEQLKILMPNSEKIFEILSGIFDSYFNLIESNTIHIRTLEKTRDTLLPKLLSGEIDVSELEI